MSADEQAIRSLLDRWHKATTAGDVESVLGLMAKDVVFLVAGQPPMQGRAAFEQGLRDLLRSHRLETTGEIQEIYVSGDLGYCWSILNVRVIPLAGGSSVARSGSALSILRKQSDGVWVVVRDANLLTAES